MQEELVAPGMNATEPFVKCYSDTAHGIIASPKEEQKEQEHGNGHGMVLLCSLLRLIGKWSQGLAAPQITRQL